MKRTKRIKKFKKRYKLRWAAFSYVMEWILDCIHFDTIIDDPDIYAEFVDFVRSGEIAEVINDMIEDVLYEIEHLNTKRLNRYYNNSSIFDHPDIINVNIRT